MTRPRRFVLLAEDNPGDVYLVREALREHEMDVEFVAVEDGEKAIAILEDPAARIPDLVLLDVNLPRRTGYEVLETMRSTDRLRHLPVVLLTSSESPKDRLLADELGASAWFHKPAGLDEFMKLGALAKSLLVRTAES